MLADVKLGNSITPESWRSVASVPQSTLYMRVINVADIAEAEGISRSPSREANSPECRQLIAEFVGDECLCKRSGDGEQQE